MKVPGIEEMVKTFNETAGKLGNVNSPPIRECLLAVFETHVKGMLAQAYRAGNLDGAAGVAQDAVLLAETAISQLKEPRHD